MLSFVLSLLLSVSHAADNSCEGVLGSAPSSTVYESLSTEARAAMTELAGLRITVDLEYRSKTLGFFKRVRSHQKIFSLFQSVLVSLSSIDPTRSLK